MRIFSDILFKGGFGKEHTAVACKLHIGNQAVDSRFIINEMKGKIATTEKSLASLAERILEFDLVTRLDDVSDLDSAIEVARLLNTNANPEKYAEIAAR